MELGELIYKSAEEYKGTQHEMCFDAIVEAFNSNNEDKLVNSIEHRLSEFPANSEIDTRLMDILKLLYA